MEWFWIVVGLGVVAFFFATCVCCCGVMFQDVFNRSDSTSLGSDWSEVSGAWEINTQAMHCTAAGIAISNTALTADQFKLYSYAGGSDGDIVRLLFGYSDSDNYHCVEWEDAGAFADYSRTIRIIERVAGTETVLAERYFHGFGRTVATPRMAVCRDGEGRVTAGETDMGIYGEFTASCLVPSLAGSKVGVAVATLVGPYVLFDDFHASGPNLQADDRSNTVGATCGRCPKCMSCYNDRPPQQIQVDISGLANGSGASACADCASLDGTYVADYVGSLGSGNFGFDEFNALRSCAWVYEFSGACGMSQVVVTKKDITLGTPGSGRWYVMFCTMAPPGHCGSHTAASSIIFRASSVDHECGEAHIESQSFSFLDFSPTNRKCNGVSATVTLTIP